MYVYTVRTYRFSMFARWLLTCLPAFYFMKSSRLHGMRTFLFFCSFGWLTDSPIITLLVTKWVCVGSTILREGWIPVNPAVTWAKIAFLSRIAGRLDDLLGRPYICLASSSASMNRTVGQCTYPFTSFLAYASLSVLSCVSQFLQSSNLGDYLLHVHPEVV